jgi:O-antigen/teichoic acid export membrane protein
MGLIVIALSASGVLIAIAGLGVRPMMVKEIAAEPGSAPSLLGTAIIVRMLFVIPSVALTALYVWLGHFSGQRALVLFLALAVAMLLLFLEPMLAAFQAIEQMKYLAYNDVINKSLMTVLGIGLVLIGFHAIAIVALMVVTAAVSLLMMTRWFAARFRIDWRTNLAQIRRFLAQSVTYSAFILFFTVYLWIDSLILALMTPPEVVGWYGVPTRLFGTMLVIPVIVSTVWLPRLALAFRRGQLRRAARTPIQLVLVLSLPVAVGSALIAGPFIQLFYGPAFAPSAIVAVILAMTTIPMSLNIMVCQLLIASNRLAIWTLALAGATIVNPVLNVILIRYFQAHDGNGAIGAAWSLLLTETAMAILGIVIARSFIDWLGFGRLLRSLPVTFGMAGVVYLCRRLGLAAEVLAGLSSFALLALLLRVITPTEISGWLHLVRQQTGPRLDARPAGPD